jgi:hypothetical protein
MSESSTSSDTVEIGFSVFGKVEIDDDVDCLDVDSAGEEIGANKISTNTGAEIVKDSVAMGLEHFCVRVETRVSALCDSFG